MRNPSGRRKNKKAVKYIDLDWIKVASDWAREMIYWQRFVEKPEGRDNTRDLSVEGIYQ